MYNLAEFCKNNGVRKMFSPEKISFNTDVYFTHVYFVARQLTD